jgi:hypothetical protein
MKHPPFISALLPVIMLTMCPRQVVVAQTNRIVAAHRPELIYQSKGSFENTVERPLCYWPVGGDFVITNGAGAGE